MVLITVLVFLCVSVIDGIEDHWCNSHQIFKKSPWSTVLNAALASSKTKIVDTCCCGYSLRFGLEQSLYYNMPEILILSHLVGYLN